MTGETQGGPSGEPGRFELRTFWEILPADRNRASIAVRFVQEGDQMPQVVAVGVAPEVEAPGVWGRLFRKPTKKRGPTVLVVCDASNLDSQSSVAIHTDERDKKRIVAGSLANRIKAGGLQSFARQYDPNTLQSNSVRIASDGRAETPRVVVVREKKTGTTTAYALCWGQEEANHLLELWEEGKRPSIGAKSQQTQISFSSLEQLAKPGTPNRKKGGLSALKMALAHVSKRRKDR